MKAVIFCVETNKKANTDWVYILETINRYYGNSQLRVDRIYMDGKGNYKSKHVISEMSSWKEVYASDVLFIYCIDTDNYEMNADHKREFGEIQRYCKDNGYEFVWFCHDIEEVYWGHLIDDVNKKKESIRFMKTRQIEKVNYKNLCAKTIRKNCSNIMDVLDHYIDRK